MEKNSTHTQTKTGTTVIGFTYNKGKSFLMASDKQITSGGFMTVHSPFRKIEEISKNIGIAFAGAVSAAQLFCKYIKYDLEHYKQIHQKDLSGKGVAFRCGLILRSVAEGQAEILLGTIEEEKAVMWSIDSGGSYIPDNYCSTGSGSLFAYTNLKKGWKYDMNTKEAVKFAYDTILLSSSIDVYSGLGVEIFCFEKGKVINIDGEEEINKLIKNK